MRACSPVAGRMGAGTARTGRNCEEVGGDAERVDTLVAGGGAGLGKLLGERGR